MEKYEEALDAFDAAMEVDPTSALAFHNSAFLLKNLGYNERAIQLYHMAEERGMVDKEVYSSLALLYCRVGNWDKARLYWRRFYICLVNDEKQNLSNRSFVLFDLGYEVVGTVEIDFTGERANILSVNFRTENTFFDIPTMRFLLKYAHILNIPFLISAYPKTRALAKIIWAQAKWRKAR
jgi:tetratricopeptide (TPR) repeat protein